MPICGLLSTKGKTPKTIANTSKSLKQYPRISAGRLIEAQT